MKIAFTGHRLHYWTDFEKEKLNFCKKLRLYLSTLKVDYTFIVGGCPGIDHIAAKYAMIRGIVFDLYVPFPIKVHSKYWNTKDRLSLSRQHDVCRSKKIISKDYYVGAYFQRDQAMVNDADLLIAYFKKSNNKSGSAHCVKYALTQNVPVIDLRKGKEHEFKRIRRSKRL